MHSITSTGSHKPATQVKDMKVGQVMIVRDRDVPHHNGKYLMMTDDNVVNLADPTQTWYKDSSIEGDVLSPGTIIHLVIKK